MKRGERNTSLRHVPKSTCGWRGVERNTSLRHVFKSTCGWIGVERNTSLNMYLKVPMDGEG